VIETHLTEFAERCFVGRRHFGSEHNETYVYGHVTDSRNTVSIRLITAIV